MNRRVFGRGGGGGGGGGGNYKWVMRSVIGDSKCEMEKNGKRGRENWKMQDYIVILLMAMVLIIFLQASL